MLQAPVQGAVYLLLPEGLDQVVKGVDLEGLVAVALVGGGEDERGARIHVLDALCGLHAVELGHIHVQEDDVRPLLLEEAQALLAVLRLAHDLEPLRALDELAQDQAHAGLVVAQVGAAVASPDALREAIRELPVTITKW